jgi:hypothetical protein
MAGGSDEKRIAIQSLLCLVWNCLHLALRHPLDGGRREEGIGGLLLHSRKLLQPLFQSSLPMSDHSLD